MAVAGILAVGMGCSDLLTSSSSVRNGASVAIIAQDAVAPHIENNCENMVITIDVNGNEEHHMAYGYQEGYARIGNLPPGEAQIVLSAETNTIPLWTAEHIEVLEKGTTTPVEIDKSQVNSVFQQWNDDLSGLRIWFPKYFREIPDTFTVPPEMPKDFVAVGRTSNWPRVMAELRSHDTQIAEREVFVKGYVQNNTAGFDHILPGSFAFYTSGQYELATIEYITDLTGKLTKNQLVFTVHNNTRIFVTFQHPQNGWDDHIKEFNVIKKLIQFY